MTTVKIELEISECYDRLSILEIKYCKCQDIKKKYQIKDDIEYLESQLNIAIGIDLAHKIYKSKEYKRLYQINKDLFELIDKIKLGGIDALIPFKLNNKRFEAKNNLQKTFFSEVSKEIKL